MTRRDIILAAALRMDEISASSDVYVPVSTSDNDPLYAQLNGVLDESLVEIYAMAPYWRLPQSSFLDDGDVAYATDRHSGRVYLRLSVPENFLKVAEINCAEWERPIIEIFAEGSDMGRRQHNRHLMGKSARPVGVMSHGEWDGAQIREIDCYSFDAGTVEATSLEASYIARPEIRGTGLDVNVSSDILVPGIVEPLEWLMASKVFGLRGDERTALCMKNVEGLLI